MLLCVCVWGGASLSCPVGALSTSLPHPTDLAGAGLHWVRPITMTSPHSRTCRTCSCLSSVPCGKMRLLTESSCGSVAGLWMLYMGSRALFTSPESHLLNRTHRCSPIKPEAVRATGEKWFSVREQYILKDISKAGIFSGTERRA